MEKKSRALRALDAFGLVTALLMVLTWLYGLQARNWLRARQLKKSHPAISLVPRPLQDTSMSNEKGMTLVAFDYRFEVPWTQIESHKTVGLTAAYLFPGGFGLTVWNAAKLTSTMELMREATQRANRPFTNFLGARTEYELLDEELRATPEEMSPFMAKQDAFRQGLLLSLKEVELPSRAVSEMYAFDARGWRVFQLGDPKEDGMVEVRCFDAEDRETRFLFASERGANTTLSQGDVNRVVQTLHPAQ